MIIKDLKVEKELKVIDYDYRKTITWNNFKNQHKGGILTTDTDPIKIAQTLITDLNKAYQVCKQATADDIRFQEQLDNILDFLAKAETVDNRFLIELEKFYQTSSLLPGSQRSPIQMLPLAPLGGPMTVSTLTKSKPN